MLMVNKGELLITAWTQTSPGTDFGSNDLFSELNIKSGTSMACPYATRVAALLKGAHPKWNPAAMRSAMITTADPCDNTLEAIKDLGDHNKPASLPAMGADPGLIYYATAEEYIRLLCDMNYTAEQIQMIAKSSAHNRSKTPSLDLNYQSFIVFFNASMGRKLVHKFMRTVTNVGDENAHYIIKVAPTTGFGVKVVPKELVFEHK